MGEKVHPWQTTVRKLIPELAATEVVKCVHYMRKDIELMVYKHDQWHRRIWRTTARADSARQIL